METKQVKQTAIFKRCKCGGKTRKKPRGCDNVNVDSPISKPDLAIYSQLEQLSLGNVPSWDSPDITTNSWAPFRLREEAAITVRNLSSDTPAINAKVHYGTAPFGIGTQITPRLTKVVNIAPNSQIQLLFPLYQETLNGDPRVGVFIAIEHPNDPKSINNTGSQVHDGGYTSESGKVFKVKIPVINDSNFTREIQLSVMPTDVLAELSMSSKVFLPYEQVLIELEITIPGFLTGTPSSIINRQVTVVGRLASGELIGGVTRLIRIDN
ncbi:hypothetical protein [Galbibacter mesophilus]|uniref:hypothetical protein n=1 Tax=Galbibacter mesophilus TaxID=379069 RepID=UPI00191D6855|nr:hypothetical protein [Galbibacter mesophilus]MCM5663647.1 hypothetical protein [Galbibacter mesophilus]